MSGKTLSLGVDVDAPADRAWAELVELDRWPEWGPTVRAARLDDGSRRLSAGATGAVQTLPGMWLPFTIDDFAEGPGERTWSWRVGGVAATGHSVRSTGIRSCRVEMTVPWWAPAYLGVVGLGLHRIRRRCEEDT